MSSEWLPYVAEKYGCGLMDIRSDWRRYLLDNDLQPEALLRDGIHLNEYGCWLMGKLVARRLVHRPDLPADEWKTLVNQVDNIPFEDGRFKCTFTGNRVVALAAPHKGAAGTVRVLIDGKAPSEYPDLYAFTRPGAGPGVDWPWTVCAPVVITSLKTPVVEDWTITITEGDVKAFRFKVHGSVTGPDGEGSSEEKFVSDSGRIVIASDAWWRRGPKDAPNPIRPGHELHFKCVLLGTDRYTPPTAPDPSREYPTVLASGLTDGEHTLELIQEGDAAVPLAALRFYNPPELPVRTDLGPAPKPGGK
jgi:hypothetical protein